MGLLNKNFISERIREIWSKLSNDKRQFVDILLHTAARSLLADTIAKEYTAIPHSQTTADSAAQLLELYIIIEAVNLMPDIPLGAGLKDSRLAVAPYLSEALASIVERDANAILNYSTTYRELGDSTSAGGIAYAEAYNLWIANTASYLQECRSIVRAVSFNELTHLWDKPAGIDYLATHYLLRTRRDCDSRRVFIYDKTYWNNEILLKRLFAELKVQSEAGVTTRVCSMEQLQQIGKGYYYPLLSFGTYDRVAMGVLIAHDTNPVVKLVHSDGQIRDAITILDDIFDHAETEAAWTEKHSSLMDSEVEKYVRRRLASLHQVIKTRSRLIK